MSTRLLLVGCGAIGSRTVSGLPEDVAYVGLCDMDVVGKENIGIADFMPADVGEKKVSVLATRIRQKYPLLRVTTFDCDVSMMGPAILDYFDTVSAAVDNDRAAYTICRIAAQSLTKPPVVFSNCDPRTGSGQVRIVNFRVNDACLGCNRTEERWEAPLSNSHGCARGAARASGHAAQLAAALQVNVLADIMNNPVHARERAGENLIVNPTAGVASKSRLTFNPDCPAFYHYYARTTDRTVAMARTVDQITLKEMLDTITHELGPHAFIELGERQCSDTFFCLGCRREVTMLRLCIPPPVCSCGMSLKPTNEFRRIKAALPLSVVSNVTLGQLGLPDGDVVLGIANESYLYFATEMSESRKATLMM